jgi:prepilin-type N-terminal cleavage/methylation domain-containing protein
MKFRKLKLFNKTESGFTLIEVIVSVAILGFISLGANISIIQLLNQSSRNSHITSASRNAMNGIYWISRDAQMAQVVAGTSGFPATSDLSLAWEDWNSVSYNATYSITEGKLFRKYTVDGNSVNTLIAEYINADPNSTNCTSDGGTLTVTITSSVGEKAKIVNVTQVRKIAARPQL